MSVFHVLTSVLSQGKPVRTMFYNAYVSVTLKHKWFDFLPKTHI